MFETNIVYRFRQKIKQNNTKFIQIEDFYCLMSNIDNINLIKLLISFTKTIVSSEIDNAHMYVYTLMYSNCMVFFNNV